MRQLYILVGAVVAGALLVSLDRYVFKGKTGWRKTVALVFALAFGVRYFSYNDAFKEIIGLSGGGLSPVLTFFSTLFIWFYYACAVMLILVPFYKMDFLRLLTKYFALPVILINIVLVNANTTLLFGEGNANASIITVILYMVELGFATAICAMYVFSDFRWRYDKKTVKASIVAALLMVAFSLQGYVFQVFFGNANPLFSVDDFTPYHRIFIYGGFIIPFLLYLLLHRRDEQTINFALVFISLATMISVCLRYKWDVWIDLRLWPLHLCNTAMFVIPFCLILKLKRLFYFTYFINILGAFLAMIMPNYSDVNLTSWELVVFWINHYCAFFMPILLVALKQFERPKIKQFIYSMIAFCVYFVAILFINAYFKDTDFFFLNSDFIPDKLGTWAENMFNFSTSFNIGDVTLVFHPIYQAAFFLVYVAVAMGMWFIYEIGYSTADLYNDMFERLRKRKINIAEYAKTSVNGEKMDNNEIYLELRHFTKQYGSSKEYAVFDANLRVDGGTIFGFLGPNGAGKSTIIKSIVGIQPITGGHITVCGFDCESDPVNAKRQIGYVPDHYALYEKLSGREYINYIADIYDVSESDRAERIDGMVELFELSDSFDSAIKTYSHGMKQKIAIMAALVHDPKVWILDEPLTGLDPNSIYQVKECMKNHAKKGNIVFFSSHIIDVVERICDEIVIIKKGNLLERKTVAEVEKVCPLEDYYMKVISDTEASRVLIGDVKKTEAKN
ncbi:MAG: YwaF family protein [Clostridia bacterium]|nr:YwaF family protein [Clostridia bacterium]